VYALKFKTKFYSEAEHYRRNFTKRISLFEFTNENKFYLCGSLKKQNSSNGCVTLVINQAFAGRFLF